MIYVALGLVLALPDLLLHQAPPPFGWINFLVPDLKQQD